MQDSSLFLYFTIPVDKKLGLEEVVFSSKCESYIKDNLVEWYNLLNEKHLANQKCNIQFQEELSFFLKKYETSSKIHLKPIQNIYPIAHQLESLPNIKIIVIIEHPLQWISKCIHEKKESGINSEPDPATKYTSEDSLVYKYCFEWKRMYYFVLEMYKLFKNKWEIQLKEYTFSLNFSERDLKLIKSICLPICKELINHYLTQEKKSENDILQYYKFKHFLQNSNQDDNNITELSDIYQKNIQTIISHGENYSGTYESRLKGLDIPFSECKGKSLLDIGSSNGNLSYQFVYRGVSSVKGYEINKKHVDFCNQFFEQFDCKTQFICIDIMKYFNTFLETLDDSYDIVLYMGVHHCFFGNHQKKYVEALHKTRLNGKDYTEIYLPHKETFTYKLIEELAKRTNTYFCYRSWGNTIGVNKQLEDLGFRIVSSSFIPNIGWGTGFEYTKIWKRI
jgi:16S rRNA G966 N2-methylase RsmD